MIERLLAAERAFEAGQLELADRLYAQVAAADPRNAIALTGRAKVAERQGDVTAARRHVARALETDPDDEAAKALSKTLAASTMAGPATEAAPAPPATPPEPVTQPAAAAASRFVPPVPTGTPPPPRSIGGAIRRFLRRLVGR